MSNIDLANFGLFMFSIFGFGVGTLILGGAIVDFDPEDTPLVSWVIGMFLFGFAMLLAYGG